MHCSGDEQQRPWSGLQLPPGTTNISQLSPAEASRDRPKESIAANEPKAPRMRRRVAPVANALANWSKFCPSIMPP
jgi:hypothetical protein